MKLIIEREKKFELIHVTTKKRLYIRHLSSFYIIWFSFFDIRWFVKEKIGPRSETTPQHRGVRCSGLDWRSWSARGTRIFTLDIFLVRFQEFWSRQCGFSFFFGLVWKDKEYNRYVIYLLITKHIFSRTCRISYTIFRAWPRMQACARRAFRSAHTFSKTCHQSSMFPVLCSFALNFN